MKTKPVEFWKWNRRAPVIHLVAIQDKATPGAFRTIPGTKPKKRFINYGKKLSRRAAALVKRAKGKR